jgi:hypothetical protein
VKQGKGFLRTVLIFVLVMVITLGGTQGAFAFMVEDDDEPVHEYIIPQAMALYSHFYDNPELNGALSTIQSGASHEDVFDHITDRLGIYVTLTHFWDADKGDDDPVNMVIIGENGINSWQKVQVLWGMALGEYAHGDYVAAYEYLGHVAHLLADMTVPAHAHEDAHPSESYEKDYMTWDTAQLTPGEVELMKQQGLVQIQEGIDPLYYLFYTANQIGDYYPSDEDEDDEDEYFGDTDTRGGWMDGVYAELGMYPIFHPLDNAKRGVIRHYAYLYAIRASATLYGLFYEAASSRSALTVVIDDVTALDIHDELMPAPDCDADFFVRIFIDGFQFWNEGNQVVDAQAISPHWAFGRNVGVTGSIPIVIQLWDEDDEGTAGGDDDPSSIDPVKDQRDLDITVDLATGAISGDITGMCGNYLEVQGHEDTNDYSWMRFRVLLPNIPPTADAGEDQTVNEGDLVTLTGSFTDPNTDDSWTYLWHMESSTNGQVIPDSSGPAFPEPSTQPFSFVPCDNGVYTFSFTVTDSYGASDSEEVVVTALNVPPVVSAPNISNQENAEFILPVVHNTSFQGTFTDAGTCDTHTALWAWGDGTTSNGNVTETNGSGSVTNSHTYSQPGDYTVTLTVTDDDSGADSETMIDQVHVADVDEALDIFNQYIQSLNKTNFKDINKAAQRKKAYNNMFSALQDMWDGQEYQGMISSMNSNIRTTFDGLVGGSTKDDWIKQDLVTQTELCQKVDDITAYLNYLLSLMP